MIGSRMVKQQVLSLGADLCGITPVERFQGAPEGFHPEDVYPECRSVVVYAKQAPATTLAVGSSQLYTHVHNVLTLEVDRIGVELSVKLEEYGVGAVPIPSDLAADFPHPGRPEGWGFISLRHAGQLAGLGVIGKNTLLVNKDYGNMIHLGAVLLDAELDPDPPARYLACRPACHNCIDACPQHALDGMAVNHELCLKTAREPLANGQLLHRCNQCRMVCPCHLGL